MYLQHSSLKNPLQSDDIQHRLTKYITQQSYEPVQSILHQRNTNYRGCYPQKKTIEVAIQALVVDVLDGNDHVVADCDGQHQVAQYPILPSILTRILDICTYG